MFKIIFGVTLYQGEDGKGGVLKKVNDARDALILVRTKLSAIRGELDRAKGELKAESVDTKLTLKNGKEKNIETIYNNLLKKVDKYKKFKPKKYNPLDYVESGLMNLEVLSVDLLYESLAALISATGSFLETQQTNLDTISGQISEIETILYGVHRTEADGEVGDLEEFEEVEGLWDLAGKAQAAADSAARALANWRAPRADDDADDDDLSSGSGSSSDTGAYTYLGIGMGVPVYDLTGMTMAGAGRGVAGARTGRTVARGGAADTSGVLGVKTESASDTTNDKKMETSD